ncbi:MAG: valine--tRNA ligase [Thermoplasmatota archaeon]
MSMQGPPSEDPKGSDSESDSDSEEIQPTADRAVQEMEERWLHYWEQEGIYAFDPESESPVYSIDTPPPTVSGKMHIGHAYSYNQMDFIARYKRMRGYNLFYPFGFDDNGLPTERLTERETGVKLHEVGRREFIRRCLAITQQYEKSMEQMWRRIGTSCDWALTYRTIDKPAQQTSQASFVELHQRKRAYRAERPTIWCPECATAIAQVETEDRSIESKFHDVAFARADGRGDVVISTTRPELIPACVALFIHPDDPRAPEYEGRKVRVPIFGHEVTILTSDKVEREKGTGLVMCCTFGDLTDIDWWSGHKLPLRVAIDSHGRMTSLAGTYAGLSTTEARTKIVQDLEGLGVVRGSRGIVHTVNVHERCGTPIEFLVTKQWFISYLDLKDEFLRKGAEVRWHPEYMRVRYDNWVKGLQWDWCISRQRYFGVPFPVWYCKGCGETCVAELEELPVDPVETRPASPCLKCGSTEFNPETDVMDTWATSSLTPQIALNWVQGSPLFEQVFPMDLRAQAHEIISFWAFNTIVKSHFHHGTIPWKDVMISGFVKLGKGKKMSKSKGDIVEPADVIRDHSADALRYWSATGASLGEDIIWNPKDLTRAQRLMTKLRNLEKFVDAAGTPWEGAGQYTDVDLWILTEYSALVSRVTGLWDSFDYTRALKETEDFLWHVFADHYVELVKSRARMGDPAALSTLRTVALGLVKMLAPVLAFSTEDLYQTYHRKDDGAKSVHVSRWPEPEIVEEEAAARGAIVKDLVAAGRSWKAAKGISLGAEIPEIEVVADGVAKAAIEANTADLLSTLRTPGIRLIDASEVEMRPVAIKVNLAKIGPKYKGLAPKIAQAVATLDPATTSPGGLPLHVDGQAIALAADEYSVESRPAVHGHAVEAVHVGAATLLLREK